MTVGTTTVLSGTSGDILYNNSGVLGNLATTGSGNVVLSASPTLTGTIGAASETLSGSLTFTASLPSSTNNGIIDYGTLGYSDSGMVGVYQGSTNSYIYDVVQNTNTGTAASACRLVANYNTTTSTYYGEFCMNGSGFSGTGALNQANNVTFDSFSADLVLGTYTANPLHFVYNNGSSDVMTINSSGVVNPVIYYGGICHEH